VVFAVWASRRLVGRPMDWAERALAGPWALVYPSIALQWSSPCGIGFPRTCFPSGTGDEPGAQRAERAMAEGDG
jgi:hypothetical protein